MFLDESDMIWTIDDFKQGLRVRRPNKDDPYMKFMWQSDSEAREDA